MACVQLCLQHTAEEKTYMPKTVGRTLITAKDYLQQNLHGNLENGPWVEEKKDGLQNKKNGT